MITQQVRRGFRDVLHPDHYDRKPVRLVGESSVIGDYDDAVDNPGSSYLWVGANHHLNRDEVAELVVKLRTWLNYKRLPLCDHKPVRDGIVLLKEFIRVQRAVIEIAVTQSPRAAVDMVAEYFEEAGVEDAEMRQLLDTWWSQRPVT